MKKATVIMHLKSQQRAATFKLHFAIIFCVITQILLSYCIEIGEPNKIANNPLRLYVSWLHFSIGASTFVLSVLLLFAAVGERGARYYYAVFLGDTKTLTNDVKDIVKKRLPKQKHGGLAVTIQGLGMLALIATSLSGLLWFVLWFFNGPFAHDAEEIHEVLTKILQVYIVGHASAGILHMKTTSLPSSE